jgi:hypothetical protein
MGKTFFKGFKNKFGFYLPVSSTVKLGFLEPCIKLVVFWITFVL